MRDGQGAKWVEAPERDKRRTGILTGVDPGLSEGIVGK